MAELKPCPFCGGKIEIVGVNNGNPFMAYCDNCGLEFGRDKEYYSYQIVEAWNTRTQPNPPLTLEQLKEMDGQPVWVEFFSKTSKTGKWQGWAIADTSFDGMSFSEHYLKFKYYGRSWKAYRYKKEGESNENR